MLIAVRALHFWALAVVVGGSALLLALGRRPKGSMAMLRLAALATAATGFGWFALVFTGVAGGPDALRDPGAWSAFAAAPFGTPWLLRVALCVVALIFAWVRAPIAFLGLGAALIVDQAWLGHAADGPAWGFAIYWLHVGAALGWVGALAMLVRVSLAERRVPPDGLALFGRFGIALVAVLLAAGLGEAAMRGVTPAALVPTPYGRVLAGKVSGLAAMLALAVFHRSRPRRTTTLWATVPAETLLGLGVLALAATLGVTPPS